jgi:hypothetical protein
MSAPFSFAQLPVVQVVSFLSQLRELAKDLSADATERQRLEAAREACLAEIEGRYATYRRVFEHIFAERRRVIDACFQVIDAGRASGDREMILGAMRELGALIQTSPFRDLETIRAVLEGDHVIEI